MQIHIYATSEVERYLVHKSFHAWPEQKYVNQQ